MDLSVDFHDSTTDEFTKRFEKIHIRVIQRSSRSYITLLENMDDDLDLDRICRAMRRAFNCNGNVKMTEQGKEVIQLQGDQHETIRAWLLEQEILTAKEAEERLVVHRAI
jgi:translation initiation factor SUI1